MGLAGAKLFAAEGGRVVATDVSAEALQEAVAEITAAGGQAIGIVLDVASPGSWDAAVAQTIEVYGKIDILVNNAGIHMAKGVLEAELEDWDRVFAVNTTGVWLGMKKVIPHLQENGGGSIVNVSSIAAIVGGFADGGGAAYSASKGAVRSLTKHVAQNFGKDSIRVNSIHPGAVFTGMAATAGLTKETMAGMFGSEIPLPPHVGEGPDIAYGMLYLASDEAKYVTGEELVIDGGWTTH
jgi:NAD(P)-dependent dehydrogenase (short-subunit alcohol dehydrogenase family)